MSRCLASINNSERGSSTIELAILFPAFILIFLGIVEFGRALWSQSTLQYAVQSAARCGAIDRNNCPSITSTITYAVKKAASLKVPSGDFAAAQQACGEYVSVSFPFSFIIPSLFPYTITLSAQSCYPIKT